MKLPSAIHTSRPSLALDVGHAVVERRRHAGGPHVGRLGEVGVDVDDVGSGRTGRSWSCSVGQTSDGTVGDGAVGLAGGRARSSVRPSRSLSTSSVCWPNVRRRACGPSRRRRSAGTAGSASAADRSPGGRRPAGSRRARNCGMAVREAGVAGRGGRDAERRRARRRPASTSCVGGPGGEHVVELGRGAARRPSTVGEARVGGEVGPVEHLVPAPATARRSRPTRPARRRRRRRIGRRPGARRRGCGCRPAPARAPSALHSTIGLGRQRQGGVEQRRTRPGGPRRSRPGSGERRQEADQRRAARRWGRTARAGCGAGRRGGR